MLIDRFAEAEPLLPICTIRGGVWPRSCPSFANAGELLRMILIPGARLGVSELDLCIPIDRLSCDISLPCSCLGGDDGTGASSSSACVTFENLMAGGGSSSESLSPMSIRLIIGASDENPCTPFETDSGEFRLRCGRVGCATAAIIPFNLLPMRFFLLSTPVRCRSPS